MQDLWNPVKSVETIDGYAEKQSQLDEKTLRTLLQHMDDLWVEKIARFYSSENGTLNVCGLWSKFDPANRRLLKCYLGSDFEWIHEMRSILNRPMLETVIQDKHRTESLWKRYRSNGSFDFLLLWRLMTQPEKQKALETWLPLSESFQ